MLLTMSPVISELGGVPLRHDYYPSETATWPEAVIRAYISDAGDLEEEEEEELGEDEMFFDD